MWLRGTAARRRRLDDLHGAVFTAEHEAVQDTQAVMYLSARATYPWLALAWHDARRRVLGISYGTEEATEHERLRVVLERVGLNDAYVHPSWPIARFTWPVRR